MTVEIGKVKNPEYNEHGQVKCKVEIKIGDGIGAEWEWTSYVAVKGDVAKTGNIVWAKLCAGDYTLDPGFETTFTPDQIEAD